MFFGFVFLFNKQNTHNLVQTKNCCEKLLKAQASSICSSKERVCKEQLIQSLRQQCKSMGKFHDEIVRHPTLCGIKVPVSTEAGVQPILEKTNPHSPFYQAFGPLTFKGGNDWTKQNISFQPTGQNIDSLLYLTGP